MNATGMLGFWTAFLLFFVINMLCSWANRFDITLGLVAAGMLRVREGEMQLSNLVQPRHGLLVHSSLRDLYFSAAVPECGPQPVHVHRNVPPGTTGSSSGSSFPSETSQRIR